MRVFVAGATGAIGRPLVGQLHAAGHQVVGATRSPERAAELRGMGAEAIVCDALDADGLRQAVAEARPEAVIHELTDLPARLDPRRYQTQLAGTNRLRREGTRNLIGAFSASGATRLIAQSIAFAYEPSGGWVKDEEARLDLGASEPIAAAVAAVADLETQVLGAGGIVLRYGYFYGPRTAFSADGFYAELVRRRRLPVIGSGTGMWSFVHVEDAAAATVAALERGRPGVYNVTDDEPAQAREWIPVYAAAVGAKPPLRVPVWLGRLLGGTVAVAGMTAQRGASNAKAKRELDWTPRHPSWRDGFRKLASA
ncbi:MAG TPA: NAD(P)-dependent oxidoreductase [Solirubrobacteraceae bacterium]|nr:NAD(P)-dependent oxidoreductase [Solirubrobacteraceae bacterium]